jgi:hypothetical protein
VNSLSAADARRCGPATSMRIAAVLLAHGCLLPSVEPTNNDGSAAIAGSSRTQVDLASSADTRGTAPATELGNSSSSDETARSNESAASGGASADASTDTADQMSAMGSAGASALDLCANAVCTADYPCRQGDASYTCRGQFVDWPPGYNASSFADNQDGTVTDARSGLSWQQDITVSYAPTCTARYANASAAVDSCTWEQALSYCTSLTLAGGGWRLPTRAELETIVDFGRIWPAINIGLFPDTLSQLFWSSSPTVSSPADAWFVDFTEGAGDYKAKGSQLRVRCVR